MEDTLEKEPESAEGKVKLAYNLSTYNTLIEKYLNVSMCKPHVSVTSSLDGQFFVHMRVDPFPPLSQLITGESLKTAMDQLVAVLQADRATKDVNTLQKSILKGILKKSPDDDEVEKPSSPCSSSREMDDNGRRRGLRLRFHRVGDSRYKVFGADGPSDEITVREDNGFSHKSTNRRGRKKEKKSKRHSSESMDNEEVAYMIDESPITEPYSNTSKMLNGNNGADTFSHDVGNNYTCHTETSTTLTSTLVAVSTSSNATVTWTRAGKRTLQSEGSESTAPPGLSLVMHHTWKSKQRRGEPVKVACYVELQSEPIRASVPVKRRCTPRDTQTQAACSKHDERRSRVKHPSLLTVDGKRAISRAGSAPPSHIHDSGYRRRISYPDMTGCSTLRRGVRISEKSQKNHTSSTKKVRPRAGRRTGERVEAVDQTGSDEGSDQCESVLAPVLSPCFPHERSSARKCSPPPFNEKEDHFIRRARSAPPTFFLNSDHPKMCRCSRSHSIMRDDAEQSGTPSASAAVVKAVEQDLQTPTCNELFRTGKRKQNVEVACVRSPLKAKKVRPRAGRRTGERVTADDQISSDDIAYGEIFAPSGDSDSSEGSPIPHSSSVLRRMEKPMRKQRHLAGYHRESEPNIRRRKSSGDAYLGDDDEDMRDGLYIDEQPEEVPHHVSARNESHAEGASDGVLFDSERKLEVPVYNPSQSQPQVESVPMSIMPKSERGANIEPDHILSQSQRQFEHVPERHSSESGNSHNTVFANNELGDAAVEKEKEEEKKIVSSAEVRDNGSSPASNDSRSSRRKSPRSVRNLKHRYGLWSEAYRKFRETPRITYGDRIGLRHFIHYPPRKLKDIKVVSESGKDYVLLRGRWKVEIKLPVKGATVSNWKEIIVGDVVWVRWSKNVYWPATVYEVTECYPPKVTVFWVNDTTQSTVDYAHVDTFDMAYHIRFDQRRSDPKYVKAVAKALRYVGKMGFWETFLTKKIYEELIREEGPRFCLHMSEEEIKRVENSKQKSKLSKEMKKAEKRNLQESERNLQALQASHFILCTKREPWIENSNPLTNAVIQDFLGSAECASRNTDPLFENGSKPYFGRIYDIVPKNLGSNDLFLDGEIKEEEESNEDPNSDDVLIYGNNSKQSNGEVAEDEHVEEDKPPTMEPFSEIDAMRRDEPHRLPPKKRLGFKICTIIPPKKKRLC